jgi:CSLREA domain-containing protein
VTLRFLFALVASLLLAAPAQAATIVVTKKEDSRDFQCNADCSLREAVDVANSNGVADEIVLPAGVLRLTLFPIQEDNNAAGDIDVLSDLTIRGAGAAATTIQIFNDDRILDLHGSEADLRLFDLTVTGGRALEPEDRGGGIRSIDAGEVLLERVVVRGNLARGAASNGFGGGIYKEEGPLVAHDSAIVGNVATSIGTGGGIFMDSAAGSLSLTNVTIAENLVTGGSGGGIFFNAAVPATIVNTTIAGNQAAFEGGIGGSGDGVHLRSSILAGNSGSQPTANCQEKSGLLSEGGNVLAPECGVAQASDAVTAQPLLGPLSASAIPVLEPLAGSPSLDRAVGPCPATDARGIARPQGPGCDAGSAELPVAGPPAPPSTSAPGAAPAAIARLAGLKALPKTLKLKEGKISVALQCLAGPTCAGGLKLTRPGPKKSGGKRIAVLLARKNFSIPGGGQTVVKAPLTKRGKAATNGRPSLGATLTVKLNGIAKPLTRAVQISR